MEPVQLCTALVDTELEHWPPRVLCRSAYKVSLYAGPDAFAATSCFASPGRAYTEARLSRSCNTVEAWSVWPSKPCSQQLCTGVCMLNVLQHPLMLAVKVQCHGAHARWWPDSHCQHAACCKCYIHLLSAVHTSVKEYHAKFVHQMYRHWFYESYLVEDKLQACLAGSSCTLAIALASS